MNVMLRKSQSKVLENDYNNVCFGLADVMVPRRERTEYLYELRCIAENIVRERLEQSEPHPPVHCGSPVFQGGKVHESFREIADSLGNAEHPPPHSPHATMDSTCTPADSQAIPAFDIPMTQDKTLEELPSQLDFELYDPVAPTPAVAVASVTPPVTEMNAFVQVAEIASEAVKNAMLQPAEEET